MGKEHFAIMDLIDAAGNGDVDQVKQLLAGGVSVDMFDFRGLTPLLLASYKNHPAVVAILLAHDASVDFVNAYGYTSLHYSSRGGHTEVMRHLLAAGASRDIDPDGGTPLDYAEMDSQTAAVELLTEWPENLAVDEELPPQATDSLEQAIEQDLDRVAGEVCEDGKWKRWV